MSSPEAVSAPDNAQARYEAEHHIGESFDSVEALTDDLRA